jgi:DNA-directed RNA polymerase subunit beta
VRDVHKTHYGRMCPIETPEGPNIGLIGSLSSYATVSEHGFIQSPYRVVKDGKPTQEVHYLDASEEERYIIAQASADIDAGGNLSDPAIVRSRQGEFDQVSPSEVHYMDVAPEQIVSVATALIPFLEHDDANRALMGSNMMRQAVPLLISEAPTVGTGLEYRAAVDTGDVRLADRAGTVRYVDADRIEVQTPTARSDRYEFIKFMRSNQGTLIHQKPIVLRGQTVEAAGCWPTVVDRHGRAGAGQEPARGLHVLEGYNFEDAIILRSARQGGRPLLGATPRVRGRRPHDQAGDEEITRDIPEPLGGVAEGPRRSRHRPHRRRGRLGDLLVGKVTPKGETELTAEEKLIRAIFKEKAREVRDTSLKVPHGEGGKVIDVKIFSRDAGDDLPAGVNELVRVYVAKKRKIAEGDKLAGRHGNKGVISKIVPEEDLPFLADGTPVDVILNPLGVPSRMNIGQILECHLGFAARYRDGDHGGAPEWIATPVFDGATVKDVDSALVDWQRTHKDSRVQFSVDDDDGTGRRVSGKLQLWNGRSGEPYDQKVTVGYMYILKLLHLVDDKIHARSTGPYSLVTQQPLGGKAQFGGQRFGEMEVWALEAYGAAYTLQEMLTIKSDDTSVASRPTRRSSRARTSPSPPSRSPSRCSSRRCSRSA